MMATRSFPQLFFISGLHGGSFTLAASSTPFHPAAVEIRNRIHRLLTNVRKFVVFVIAPLRARDPNKFMPSMAYMNLMRNSSVPIFVRAGADLTIVNSSFRIPFAPSKNRSNRPRRKTRTTRNKPGDMKNSSSWVVNMITEKKLREMV